MSTAEELLKAILAIVARAAFPPEALARIAAPTIGSEKELMAYNLCSAETSNTDTTKKERLDKGELQSSGRARWVEAGVVVTVNPNGLPLHFYPVTEKLAKIGKWRS